MEEEASSANEVSSDQILRALKAALFWENAVLSSTLCILGAIIFVLGDIVLTGKSRLSPLSGVPVYHRGFLRGCE